MDTKTSEIVRTTIDLPVALNEKLLKLCETTRLSRHQQMIFLLEKSFETAANGKKEKAK